MPTHEPKYYLRMFLGDRWYVLMAVKYDRKNRSMIPTWRKESSVVGEQPYLYRTLVGARMGLDRHVTSLSLLKEVKVWEDENVRA